MIIQRFGWALIAVEADKTGHFSVDLVQISFLS
jgi:hypothetical protein